MNVFIKTLPSLWGEDVIRLITAEPRKKATRMRPSGAGDRTLELGARKTWVQILTMWFEASCWTSWIDLWGVMGTGAGQLH